MCDDYPLEKMCKFQITAIVVWYFLLTCYKVVQVSGKSLNAKAEVLDVQSQLCHPVFVGSQTSQISS